MGVGCVLEVRVVPNAKRDGFAGVMDDGETLKVRVSAQAVDGKANAALVRCLAERLGVRKGAVRIEGGERSRLKVIRVDGVGRGKVLERLAGSV